MHKHKPYTYNSIRTYAHYHRKVGKLSAATWRISSISCRCVLVLFRLRSTSAATWRISCNTYTDALNFIEFCIVPLLLCHFVHHLGICNPICIKLLQLMCAVITHKSVKKKISLHINKWRITANYNVSRPPILSTILEFEIRFVSNSYRSCPVLFHDIQNKNDV